MVKGDNIKMIFESERCYIRRFTDNDIDDFILYRNNPEWMRFQGFQGLSKREYEEILLEEPVIENGAQFAIISKSNHDLIGDVFIKKEEDTFWIGYTVSPSVKRQGYAYEVVTSMILWIKQQGEFTIKAGTVPENISSVRLLEKAGFLKSDEDNGELIYSLQQE